MVQIAILLVLVVVGVLLFAKWHNSKTINNLTNDLTHEKDFTKPETDELIDSAKEADEALNQRVDESKEKVEEIKKNVDKMKKYKDERGGEDAVK